jgi:hypothetical protein
MNRIIFKKLTIKEKKTILAGVNVPGKPDVSVCIGTPDEIDGVHCKPSLPDSPCVQTI